MCEVPLPSSVQKQPVTLHFSQCASSVLHGCFEVIHPAFSRSARKSSVAGFQFNSWQDSLISLLSDILFTCPYHFNRITSTIHMLRNSLHSKFTVIFSFRSLSLCIYTIKELRGAGSILSWWSQLARGCGDVTAGSRAEPLIEGLGTKTLGAKCLTKLNFLCSNCG